MDNNIKNMNNNTLAAFNEDIYLQDEFKSILKRYPSIDTVIETGTYLGQTTIFFASLVKNVYTIEISDNYYNSASEYLSNCNNVTMLKGSSPEILEKMLSNNTLDPDKTILFLDAHWYNYCPLLDEIGAFSKYSKKPKFIMIHDFKVEGKPEFGYDSYNGQDYTFDWVKPSLDKLYGVDGYEYYFNKKATGASRGCLFVYEK